MVFAPHGNGLLYTQISFLGSLFGPRLVTLSVLPVTGTSDQAIKFGNSSILASPEKIREVSRIKHFLVVMSEM